MNTEPVLSFEDRKKRAASLLYALYKALTDGNAELLASLATINSILKRLSLSISDRSTETDQNLLTVKLEPVLAKVEPFLGEREPITESLIDQLEQAETEPPSKVQFDPIRAKLRLYILTILKQLTRQPSPERSVLRNGWKRLAVEFKDPAKSARKSRVGAAGSGMSLGLWILVLLYLAFGMPAGLSMLPSGGSRDFFWAAVVVALLLGLTIATLTRRTLLHIREMLWALAFIELVLLGSIWFMTGMDLFDQINLLHILTWFLYLQAFILVPWIGSWALIHWFWPSLK